MWLSRKDILLGTYGQKLLLYREGQVPLVPHLDKVSVRGVDVDCPHLLSDDALLLARDMNSSAVPTMLSPNTLLAREALIKEWSSSDSSSSHNISDSSSSQAHSQHHDGEVEQRMHTSQSRHQYVRHNVEGGGDLAHLPQEIERAVACSNFFKSPMASLDHSDVEAMASMKDINISHQRVCPEVAHSHVRSMSISEMEAIEKSTPFSSTHAGDQGARKREESDNETPVTKVSATKEGGSIGGSLHTGSLKGSHGRAGGEEPEQKEQERGSAEKEEVEEEELHNSSKMASLVDGAVGAGHQMKSEILLAGIASSIGQTQTTADFRLTWYRSLPQPVMGVAAVDILGAGHTSVAVRCARSRAIIR